MSWAFSVSNLSILSFACFCALIAVSLRVCSLTVTDQGAPTSSRRPDPFQVWLLIFEKSIHRVHEDMKG